MKANRRTYKLKIFVQREINCILLLVIGFFLVGHIQVWASPLTITLTKGADKATSIAIVPFAWEGQGILPDDVAEIISINLERSGYFKSLPRQDMLSRPTLKSKLFFREWRVLGVEYLLLGKIKHNEVGNYEFAITLVDIFKETTVVKHKGEARRLRELGYYISDVVYKHITGVRGVFSTNIMYVAEDRKKWPRKPYRLQITDIDGKERFTVFASEQPILSPAWHPDGDQILFVSYHHDRRPAIFMQNLGTGRQHLLAKFPGINGAPAWSPKGDKIALVLSKDGNPEIYLYHIASKDWQRLTHHYAIDTEPSWSSDGERIIFTSDRGGRPQIYEIRINDRRLQRLSFEGKYNTRGQLTPDQKFLFMLHQVKGNVFRIGVYDFTRNLFGVITHSTMDEGYSIAPNGRFIAYSTQLKNKAVLQVMSLDTKASYVLSLPAHKVREPAWSPYKH